MHSSLGCPPVDKLAALCLWGRDGSSTVRTVCIHMCVLFTVFCLISLLTKLLQLYAFVGTL